MALSEAQMIAWRAAGPATEEVNRLHREVRHRMFDVLLIQAPVAGDLREVIALLFVAVELERIGDHAVSIRSRRSR